MISGWLGCAVEDLAIVVLTHELAHAYTQLGADIDGRRWAAASFAKAETELKEGLAQYYTERVLRRVERRYGGALKVFLDLVPRQPEPYRAFQPWAEKSSPEAVRRAMLEVRRWNESNWPILKAASRPPRRSSVSRRRAVARRLAPLSHRPSGVRVAGRTLAGASSLSPDR